MSPPTVKQIPFSIEAECSVLGGLLLDDDAWSRLSGMLKHTDFYRREHALIFQTIEYLKHASSAVDLITVYEQLESSGVAKQVGGLTYLNSLAQYVPNAMNIRRYAAIVQERAQRRTRASALVDVDVLYASRQNLSEGANRADIVIASASRWSNLFASLARNPRLMHELEPRAFEELIAELLSREGLDVSLTPTTRDGGRDILAFADSPVGRHLYYVECKRYAPTRPIDVSLVRQLYGVIEAERATAGLLVTTSRFTADAKAFGKTVSNRLSFKDYEDLTSWIARHNRPG